MNHSPGHMPTPTENRSPEQSPCSWSLRHLINDALPLKLAVISLFLLLPLTGCDRVEDAVDKGAEESASSEQQEASEQATDDGREPEAMRLITTSGALTEIVFALDRGDSVVGVDTSSTYPEATGELPKVGYYRSLSAEGLASLEPTHLLVGPDAGPDSALRQLESTGVELLRVRKPTSVSDIPARIEEVGAALHAEEEAQELSDEVAEDIEALQEQGGVEGNPKGLFLYARGADTLLIAGSNTSAEMMFELAGVENAIDSFEDFRPLNAEAAVAAAPTFIVVPEKGLESIGGTEGLLSLPGIEQTPAGQNRAFIAVDDLKFLGGGPRAPEAARELRESIENLSAAQDGSDEQ